MSNDNNENIITDLNDGKNFRREVDYNIKKIILICFHGKAYRTSRLKDVIKDILILMRAKKGQDFYEKILKIRTSTRILFSKSPNEIFNHELIEGIYIEKEKYESTDTKFIIELYLAILEQFGYGKEELRIIFTDEKHPNKADTRSIDPIIWGDSGKEYIWDLDDINGIHHGYLKIPNISNIYNKIPKTSAFNQDVIIIDYKDGEILDRHIQASHMGELRIGKPLYTKHGISTDSIIEDDKQFKVRCGFLYPNIRNYILVLDFQEILPEKEAIKIKHEEGPKMEIDKERLPIVNDEEATKETGEEATKETGEEATKETGEEATKETGEEIIITEHIDIDDYISDNVPDEDKDVIKSRLKKDKSRINSLIEKNKDETIKFVVKEYCTKIIAEKEIREKEKNRQKLDEEKKKKEDEIRSKIDRELEFISNLPYDDLERMLHYNKNVDLDGPPYVGKTYAAKDCAVRYISRFVKAETDDKLNEFISKGYIKIFPSHSNLDYSGFVEGYKYDNGKPVLKPGILKILSKESLGSVLRLDDKDVKNKQWIEIFNIFIGKKMSRKEIDELFKYAIPRVLIIPDFTRGDVASILGNTNTIIDKPYRLGELQGMPIFLEDSGEEFGIPSNLYIIVDRNNAIGTGISHLDEATERRFPTKFLTSNFDNIQKYIDDNKKELENIGVYNILLESKKAMIKLNKKIIKKFGKDKELGHCYLYVKTPYELFTNWKNLIIPLIFRHRCRRDYKELNNILFNDDESQWISHEEGIHGLNSIEDLKNFIDKINSVPDQNE